jgi:hypothetical protein
MASQQKIHWMDWQGLITNPKMVGNPKPSVVTMTYIEKSPTVEAAIFYDVSAEGNR